MRLALVVPFVLLCAAGCDDDSGAADAAPDAGACSSTDMTRCLVVDDGGVSHGCAQGGMGPGDRDDGGGAPLVGPPDGGMDLGNLPFASPCFDNAQCVSNICFLYRVKGQFCTTFCSCDSDCPAPSPGCGGQGVCRMGN